MIGKMQKEPQVAMKNGFGGRCGFTLIELLTTMAIIAILVGMVIGMASYAQHKAAIARVKADMEKIKQALESYRVQYGKYPTNEVPEASANLSGALWVKPQKQGLKPFLVMEGWTDPNTAYKIYDAGGQEMRYLHRPAPPYADHNNSKFGYDLWTVVMDEQGTGQWLPDINNWSDH
ncbi:MAG: prepilin-type N-terminal cleavage/methylation domain-containing protein [Spartobacteria bacterium]|nr:prepilin-type N-terminal cleavage/methylation domain-containing protein [Spartobacteria bacterium]